MTVSILKVGIDIAGFTFKKIKEKKLNRTKLSFQKKPIMTLSVCQNRLLKVGNVIANFSKPVFSLSIFHCRGLDWYIVLRGG